jgi:hypothetical protein
MSRGRLCRSLVGVRRAVRSSLRLRPVDRFIGGPALLMTTPAAREALRHEADHEFIRDFRAILRFVVAVLGLQLGGVVYLIVLVLNGR